MILAVESRRTSRRMLETLALAARACAAEGMKLRHFQTLWTRLVLSIVVCEVIATP